MTGIQRTLRSLAAAGGLALAASTAMADDVGAPEPRAPWSREAAAQSLTTVDIEPTVQRLQSLTLSGAAADVLMELEAVRQRPDWPEPARDLAVFEYAGGLRGLPADAVPPSVIAWLDSYRPQALVPHEDHPQGLVPLFNVRAAASGVTQEWLRQEALREGLALLRSRPASLTDAFVLETHPSVRAGYLDALEQGTATQLAGVAASAGERLASSPELTPLAGRAALRSRDTSTLAAVMAHGEGPALHRLLREAAQAQDAELALNLLEAALADGKSETAGLAIALLYPVVAGLPAAEAALDSHAADKRLAAGITLARAGKPAPEAQPGTPAPAAVEDAALVEWVETNAFDAADRIALGYPPPIPVDTPMPFDGFRTYAGLRARHLALAEDTPWVHPEAVGETRTGRTVWAHRLGDSDTTTPWGLPEPATFTNGGIHAREWQSPETVTGILERLATGPADDHLLDYLRDHVNMVVIPVLNVDGFLQTQRTPTLNYVGADPDVPDFWPRDGRMRRKNMLGVDEDLFSRDDHLFGVDLNRNNPPYWDTTNGGRSSDDDTSLVHHGAEPQSEPETRALDAAAALGPVEQLRLYTDVHSYSLVHFWTRTDNERLAVQTEQVLDVFTDHHQAFPAGKWYAFADRNGVARNRGIGTTDEYFTAIYQVPSWTLEIEPSGGQDFHAPLPGGGADYGGAGVNGHDGFILPDAEIRRVREQLAETFTTVYYRQAGPPHIQSMRVFDELTGALVASFDWDPVDDTTRTLNRQQFQPLQLGRNYVLWLGFSKPMRWLEDGAVARFPGQDATTENTSITAVAGSRVIDVVLDETPTMLLNPGAAPDGYRFYRTDALRTGLRIPSTSANRDAFADGEALELRIWTRDMTGMGLDADPATVAGWSDGHWTGLEDTNGNSGDFGGPDQNVRLDVSTQAVAEPFVLEPGVAAAWYDPERNGEGFIIEMLPDGGATLYWFTYDDAGDQDWYVAPGTAVGNQLRFPALYRVSGGVFGPGFDPEAIENDIAGSATFTWTDCENGAMDWHIGNRRGRQALARITRLQGLECGIPRGRPIREEARFSGAWYDPNRAGEGFTVEILEDNSAVVYWFSFDTAGNRRWFFGAGALDNGTWVFPTLYTTAGPVFGAGFDPTQLDVQPWGRLELDLSCDGGEARYTSTEDDFGSGSMPLVQFTRMDGPACPQSR